MSHFVMLNHVCLLCCPVMSLVMSSNVVSAPGEVHQAGPHRDQGGAQAEEVQILVSGSSDNTREVTLSSYCRSACVTEM